MKPTLTLLTALLLAPLAALPAAEPLSTFCNPLPTPNYPVGFLARSVTHGEPEARQGWILGKPLPARPRQNPVSYQLLGLACGHERDAGNP
jgi:hypothetical protein